MKPVYVLALLGIILLLILPPALWAGLMFVGLFLAFLLGGVTVCSISVWAKDTKKKRKEQRRRRV